MKPGALGLLAAAIVFGASDLARTAEVPPALVALNLDRCPAVPAHEVQGMVGVELRRPVLLLVDPKLPGVVQASTTAVVRVSCDGLRADIALDDPLTGKTVGRVVDLAAAAPVARTHLLALSIVELLAASWIELVSNPSPQSPPVGTVATPAAREAALEMVSNRPGARRAPRLLASFVSQVSAAGPTSLGGGVTLAGDAGAPLGWMAEVAFQHGERGFALGRVTADNVSALGALLARRSHGHAALRAGVGVRGGGAWLSGTPADPETAVGGAVSGAWWGPVVLIDGSYAVGGRVVVELTIEAGRVLLPVIATVPGGESVAVDGTWLRGALGVGFML
jgi:hypothetical protein